LKTLLKAVAFSLLAIFFIFFIFGDFFVKEERLADARSNTLFVSFATPDEFITIESAEKNIKFERLTGAFVAEMKNSFLSHVYSFKIKSATNPIDVSIHGGIWSYKGAESAPLVRLQNITVNGEKIKQTQVASINQPYTFRLENASEFEVSFASSRTFSLAFFDWLKVATLVIFMTLAFVFGFFKRAKFGVSKRAALNLAIFLSLFVFLFVLNFWIGLTPDDMAQMARYKSGTFWHSYTNIGGRFGEVVWSGWLVRFAGSVWLDLLNAFVGSVFFFAFFIFVFARVPSSWQDAFAFALLVGLVTFFGCFGSSFLWGGGAVSQLWSVTLVLLFLVPFRNFSPNEPTKFGMHDALIFPLGFVAGMSHEHLGLVCGVSLVVFLVVSLVRKIRLPLWQYAATACFWLGWLALFFAPGGNLFREPFDVAIFLSFSEFLNLPFGEKMFEFKKALVFFASSEIFAVFLSCVVALFAAVLARSGQMSYKALIFVAIAAGFWFFGEVELGMVCVASLMVADIILMGGWRRFGVLACVLVAWLAMGLAFVQLEGVPARERFCDSCLLVVGILFVWRQMCELRFELLTKAFAVAVFGVGMVYVSVNAYTTSDILARQDALVKRYKASGLKEVGVPYELVVPSGFGRFVDFGILSREKTNSKNEAMAKFYEIDSVSAF